MMRASLSSIVMWAANGSSDSGGANTGESASPWDLDGLLFWTVVVVAAAAILVLVLVVNSRRKRAPPPAAEPSGRPRPRAVEHVHPEQGWDLAVLTFDHIEGAERAFAGV